MFLRMEPKLPRAQAYVTDESNLPFSASLAVFESLRYYLTILGGSERRAKRYDSANFA